MLVEQHVGVHAEVAGVQDEARPARAAVEEIEDGETCPPRGGRGITWGEIDEVRAPPPQGRREEIDLHDLPGRHATRRARRREAAVAVVVVPVAGHAIYAGNGPGQHDGGKTPALEALVRGASALGALGAMLVAVAAGTGWLYLLRELHVLTLGPRLGGALPLQQLAGGDASRSSA